MFVIPTPNPAARASTESANDKANDSLMDIDLEKSQSAYSGSTYTWRMKFKLNIEKFMDLSISLFFLINDLNVLSNNLNKPKIRSIVKHIILVISAGIKLPIVEPKKSAIANIETEIISIAITDENGILILLVPYAKHATKESIERANTNSAISNIYI